jgi:hypothetical protein
MVDGGRAPLGFHVPAELAVFLHPPERAANSAAISDRIYLRASQFAHGADGVALHLDQSLNALVLS